jgi:uncharacterized membrane protein (DUF485 family)
MTWVVPGAGEGESLNAQDPALNTGGDPLPGREPIAGRPVTTDWYVWLQQRAEVAREWSHAFCMWFRASLAYFVLPYHPSREDASTPINLKNFVPEVQVFAHGMAALLQSAAHLVSVESVERHQFREYLRSLLQDEAGWFLLQPWPTVSQTPDEQMLQFMDTVGQFRTLAFHMGQAPWVAYPAFVVMGRIFRQHVLNTPIAAWLVQRSLIPGVDEIPHAEVRYLCRYQLPSVVRPVVAWVVAKLYQWLAYLELLPPLSEDVGLLKRNYMVFILLNAEVQRLKRRWDRFLVQVHPWPSEWVEALEGTLFALQMEMKKVIHREMLGFLDVQRPAGLYMRLENSQGILRNAFQQSILSLLQTADPSLSGSVLFPDYRTKLEQSLRLREDLWSLRQLVRDVWRNHAWDRWSELVSEFRRFRNTTMHFLMYRDWTHFDEFYRQVQRVRTPAARTALLDQLNTFLGTLLKEVNKRDVLHGYPFPYKIEDD